MKTNPLNHGVIANNFADIGPVTRALVHERATELALIAGRTYLQVSQADYEQAKRELAGDVEADPSAALLEAFPESKRWDPVPGSEERQAPESGGEDEDEEGRSESEQLAEEGVGEAERDQMFQAARAAAKSGKRAS